MFRATALAVFCFTASGCHAPGVYFAGIPPARVVVGGDSFDVRVRGRLAEANRINPSFAPRYEDVALRAAGAMGIVSGCAVTEVRGDAAQITGILACGPGGRADVAAGTELYDCVVTGRHTGDPDVVITEDYACNVLPF